MRWTAEYAVSISRRGSSPRAAGETGCWSDRCLSTKNREIDDLDVSHWTASISALDTQRRTERSCPCELSVSPETISSCSAPGAHRPSHAQVDPIARRARLCEIAGERPQALDF